MGMPTQAFPELQMAVLQTPNNMDAHVTLGNLLLEARVCQTGRPSRLTLS